MLSQTEAKQLIAKVLSFSKADDCDVTVGGVEHANTRFARNSITTSGRATSIALRISSTKGTKTGTIATNETSDTALRAAVARSEELAALAPPDPEYMEPVGPQKYPEISSFDPATAAAGAKEMLPGVRAAIEGAEGKNLTAAGYFEREAAALAVGNKRGNFGYTTRTTADYSVTARTADGTGSGWGAGEGWHLSDVDAPAAARVAIGKSLRSQNPRRLDPGKYTVILEPAAVDEMMGFLAGSFNARNAEEGRSLLTRRGGGTLLGEKLFSEKVTARSDPFDPRLTASPWSGQVSTSLGGVGQFFFGGGGGGFGGYLPAQKMTWIEKGVIKNLAYSRYWAKKKGAEPTPPPGANLVLDGGENSIDDLVASTERGLLITRFWYIRFVNPQTVQLTGLTRDGVFLIENGKIAYPVMNFRWNESPANVLANLEAMSRPVRIGNSIVPAMKAKEFTFTSLSDAV